MRDLHKGDYGGEVVILQRLLNALSQPSPHLTYSAYFGDSTFNAVVGFQKDHSLKSDGVVDITTWNAMGILVGQNASAWYPWLGEEQVSTLTKLTAEYAPAPAPAKPKTGDWMAVARAEKKLWESTLDPTLRDGHVREYFNLTSLAGCGISTAWCGAFVNWVLSQAGVSGPATPTWAPAYLNEDWGSPLYAPKEGAVTVVGHRPKLGEALASELAYDAAKDNSAALSSDQWVAYNKLYAQTTHVAFCASATATSITLLGGNQGGQVSEISWGLGAYVVCGYRWPPV